jgi:hypothetical protein
MELEPKEKAKKIFDSFKDESFAGTEFYRMKNAQRTSLLCVDEIIALLCKGINEGVNEDIKYWQKVKEEIETFN